MICSAVIECLAMRKYLYTSRSIGISSVVQTMFVTFRYVDYAFHVFRAGFYGIQNKWESRSLSSSNQYKNRFGIDFVIWTYNKTFPYIVLVWLSCWFPAYLSEPRRQGGGGIDRQWLTTSTSIHEWHSIRLVYNKSMTTVVLCRHLFSGYTLSFFMLFTHFLIQSFHLQVYLWRVFCLCLEFAPVLYRLENFL